MESPAEWKRCECAVNDAYAEWSRVNRAGGVGLSLPAMVATRLREAGLVDDAAEEPIGVTGLLAYNEQRAPAMRAAALEELERVEAAQRLLDAGPRGDIP